jgi:meiotically up-regulated gene 157 (Mug157) protein
MMVINKICSIGFVIFWSLVIIMSAHFFTQADNDENASILEMFNLILVEVLTIYKKLDNNKRKQITKDYFSFGHCFFN